MFYVDYTTIKIKKILALVPYLLLKDPIYRNYWLVFQTILHYLILLESFHYFNFKGANKILKHSHGKNPSYFSFYFLATLQLSSFSLFPKDCSFGSRISKYSRLPSTGLSEASTGVWSFFLIQINTATLMTFSTKRALKLKRIKGTKLHSNSSSTTNLKA